MLQPSNSPENTVPPTSSCLHPRNQLQDQRIQVGRQHAHRRSPRACEEVPGKANGEEEGAHLMEDNVTANMFLTHGWRKEFDMAPNILRSQRIWRCRSSQVGGPSGLEPSWKEKCLNRTVRNPAGPESLAVSRVFLWVQTLGVEKTKKTRRSTCQESQDGVPNLEVRGAHYPLTPWPNTTPL